LVTFVTAGYPTIDDTVPILLAMQAGGADIIELGVPFSDPIADGPAIQETNTVHDFTTGFLFAHQISPRWR
jgi:tryptophan synthase